MGVIPFANDDLKGKTTHFTGFYTHTISGPKIPKPHIVREYPPFESNVVSKLIYKGLLG